MWSKIPFSILDVLEKAQRYCYPPALPGMFSIDLHPSFLCSPRTLSVDDLAAKILSSKSTHAQPIYRRPCLFIRQINDLRVR